MLILIRGQINLFINNICYLAEETKRKVTSKQVNIYLLGPVAAVHIEKSTSKVPTVELVIWRA